MFRSKQNVLSMCDLKGGVYAVLLVNRALCHKKREAWEAARQDSEAALCNDSQLMKVQLRHAWAVVTNHSTC